MKKDLEVLETIENKKKSLEGQPRLLSDHLGRRKVLFLALLGGAVGSALQGLAIACRWPFGAFLVLRGAAGMCSGIVPTLKAYIVDAFEPEDVPKAPPHRGAKVPVGQVLAYREAAGTASFVLGPLLGGLLAAHVLSAPLFFSAAASAFAAALCLAVLPEPRKRRRGPRRPGGAVRRAAPRSSKGDRTKVGSNRRIWKGTSVRK